MRFKASNLALAVVFTIATQAQSSRADEKKGEPSAISLPKSGEVTTNSQSFKPNQNGLKQLEKDLFKPFERIATEGSLDGAFVPSSPELNSATSSVQGKRTKELLERRRDWVFETPEEILATSSTDYIMSGGKEKGGDDQSKLSPLQRFYERLYSKDQKGPKAKGNRLDELYDSPKRGGLTDESDAADDPNLPLAVRETQREMKRLLAPRERKGDADSSGNNFSDVFGLGKSSQSRAEIEMEMDRMDRYKELVGLPVTPRLENDSLKQFREMIGTSSKTLYPIDTLGKMSSQNPFGGTPATAGLAPITSLLPQGAQIQASPSLSPVSPPIEPPRTLPPPVTFSAPRRAFQ